MKITRIIWLRDYVTKLEIKHGVYRDEVREILVSKPYVRRMGKGKRQKGEHLYAAHGQTDEGRYLIVFFILKADHEALIVSARDMDDKERKQYGQK